MVSCTLAQVKNPNGAQQSYRRLALKFAPLTYNGNTVERRSLVSATEVGGSVFLLAAGSLATRYKKVSSNPASDGSRDLRRTRQRQRRRGDAGLPLAQLLRPTGPSRAGRTTRVDMAREDERVVRVDQGAFATRPSSSSPRCRIDGGSGKLRSIDRSDRCRTNCQPLRPWPPAEEGRGRHADEFRTTARRSLRRRRAGAGACARRPAPPSAPARVSADSLLADDVAPGPTEAAFGAAQRVFTDDVTWGSLRRAARRLRRLRDTARAAAARAAAACASATAPPAGGAGIDRRRRRRRLLRCSRRRCRRRWRRRWRRHRPSRLCDRRRRCKATCGPPRRRSAAAVRPVVPPAAAAKAPPPSAVAATSATTAAPTCTTRRRVSRSGKRRRRRAPRRVTSRYRARRPCRLRQHDLGPAGGDGGSLALQEASADGAHAAAAAAALVRRAIFRCRGTRARRRSRAGCTPLAADAAKAAATASAVYDAQGEAAAAITMRLDRRRR